MPLLVQACVVIVTVAIVVVAIMAIRAMSRLQQATNDIAQTAESIRTAVAQVTKLTDQAQDVLQGFSSVVPKVQRISEQFEQIGERTARLSSAVVDEVEAPIRTAVAAIHGLRVGTGALLNRLTNRLAHRQSDLNGGHDHV